MCDWKPKFSWDRESYKCPHKDYGRNKEGTKDLCIFHSDQNDKNPDKFYQGIKDIYNSGKHNFRGFVFPIEFNFNTLKEELKVDHFVFSDADFSDVAFLCDVDLSHAEFAGEGLADFSGAQFTGQSVTDFNFVQFSGKRGTDFSFAQFSGKGRTSFTGAQFSGEGGTFFTGATFSGRGGTFFYEARFTGKRGAFFSFTRFIGMGKVNFSGRTFQDITLVGFHNVDLKNPKNVTFIDVDLNRVRFLSTDLSNIRFSNVFWCGRKYGSSSYRGRLKLYDEIYQEGGVIVRLLQRLRYRLKLGLYKLHEKDLETVENKDRKGLKKGALKGPNFHKDDET